MLTLIWLLFWLGANHPAVQPWNNWFTGLFIAIVLQVVWFGYDYRARWLR